METKHDEGANSGNLAPPLALLAQYVAHVAFPSSWNSGVKSATTRVKGCPMPH